MDCPEDISTYLHRVGRTARYKANGKSLLILNPAETKFLDRLKNKNIEIKKLSVNLNNSSQIQINNLQYHNHYNPT